MSRFLTSATTAAVLLVPGAAQTIEYKFSKFVQAFDRAYASAEERAAKLAVFAQNLEHIAQVQHLEEGDASYSHLSPFADLSPEEFSQRLGFRASDSAPDLEGTLDDFDTKDLPKAFDWREEGAVNPVKNQGSCGSCWAFATVANIEGAAFVATKKLVSLSEQELVDCDKVDHGCRGGLPRLACENLIKNNIGLELEQAYPYSASDGQCGASASKEVAFIGGWKSISTDEDQMAAALMQYGPLAIGINAGPMQFYNGGISHPGKASCNPQGLNHGVALVGFGEEKGRLWGSTKYWVIRNSWGPMWGEKGYYRIIRGTGECGMNTMVTTATNVTLKSAAGPSFVV